MVNKKEFHPVVRILLFYICLFHFRSSCNALPYYSPGSVSVIQQEFPSRFHQDVSEDDHLLRSYYDSEDESTSPGQGTHMAWADDTVHPMYWSDRAPSFQNNNFRAGKYEGVVESEYDDDEEEEDDDNDEEEDDYQDDEIEKKKKPTSTKEKEKPNDQKKPDRKKKKPTNTYLDGDICSNRATAMPLFLYVACEQLLDE